MMSGKKGDPQQKEIRCKWMIPVCPMTESKPSTLMEVGGNCLERKRICNARFSNYQDLHKHLCTHVDVYPSAYSTQPQPNLTCRWLNCSKQAGRLSDLRSHFIVHLEWKPFPCTYCHRTYKRKHDLRAHQKRMHSQESNLNPKASPPLNADRFSAAKENHCSPQSEPVMKDFMFRDLDFFHQAAAMSPISPVDSPLFNDSNRGRSASSHSGQGHSMLSAAFANPRSMSVSALTVDGLQPPLLHHPSGQHFHPHPLLPLNTSQVPSHSNHFSHFSSLTAMTSSSSNQDLSPYSLQTTITQQTQYPKHFDSSLSSNIWETQRAAMYYDSYYQDQLHQEQNLAYSPPVSSSPLNINEGFHPFAFQGDSHPQQLFTRTGELEELNHYTQSMDSATRLSIPSTIQSSFSPPYTSSPFYSKYLPQLSSST